MSANEVDQAQTTTEGAPDAPPGKSAVEIAARKGFGPLSPLVNKVWHGDSKPCVSCGQLVRRSDDRCDSCGENLSDAMLTRMRDFAGPWFVLEHVRPFPGVTCERLVRQVRRGVLTRMTIVRGPNTCFQWRFAGETPGLCKFLGVCWSCQSRVRIEHDRCPSCGVELGELTDDAREAGLNPSRTTAPAAAPPRLRELSDAVQRVPRTARLDDDVPRIGRIRASWIVVAIVIVLVSVLVTVVNVREADLHSSPPEPQGTSLSE